MGKQLKIYEAVKAEKDSTEPRKITIEKDRMIIDCKNGAIEVVELQLEGKKRATSADFIRGYRLDVNRVGE